MDILPQLNYLAILVAAVAAYIIGPIWFHTGVFGRAWMNGFGLKEEDLKPKPIMFIG